MKRHPLNVSYLVVGLVFLGIAGSWALREADVVGAHQTHWMFPLTLVGAGVVGLLAILAKGFHARRTPSQPAYDDTAGYPAEDYPTSEYAPEDHDTRTIEGDL